MRNNCGILAYDQLVGQLNGRTNNVSLDTLAKIAQDNGFILFPMRLTSERLKELKFPYIIHTNHHFETWESEEAINEKLGEPFYVLSAQCIPELVITETEARGVKGGDIGQMFTPPKSKSPWEAMTAGSTGGWAAPLQSWGPAINMGVSGLSNVLLPGSGIPIGMALGAAGMGGGNTGFQGTDKGWGNVGSTLGGMGLGALEGLGGSGIAGGLQGMAGGMPMGAASTYVPGQVGANAGTWGQGALGTFGSGFGQGLSNALPVMSGLVSQGGEALNKVVGLSGGAGGSAVPAAGTSLGTMTPSTQTTTLGASSLYAPSTGSLSNTGFNNILGGLTPSASVGRGAGAGTSLLSGLGNLMNNPLVGLGAIGASSMVPSPQYQQPASEDQLRQQVQSGQAASPLGQQAQAEMSRIMSAPFGTTYPDTTTDPYIQQAYKNLDQSLAVDLENMARNWTAMGGSPYDPGLMEQQEMLREKYTSAKTDISTQIAMQRSTQEIDTKYKNLVMAAQSDQNVQNELMQFVNMDINQAMLKYGIDAQSAQALRDALVKGGTLQFLSSTGALNPYAGAGSYLTR